MDESSIDPKVWDYLRRYEPDLLKKVEQDDQAALAQLEQKYEGLQGLVARRQRARPIKERVVPPDKRSQALAEIVARAVEREFGGVAEFRRQYLDGKLLPAEEISHWIRTQLAAEGDPALVYVSVPVSELRCAEIPEGGLFGNSRTENISAARSREEHLAGTVQWSVEEYVSWLGREAERVLSSPERERPSAQAAEPQHLSFFVPRAHHEGWQYAMSQTVAIRGDGTLAQLKWLAAQLTSAVPTWSQEHEVVAFILSGWSPQLPKLHGRLRLSGARPRLRFSPASRIELSIDPRTTPSAVAGFYNSIRQGLVVGRDRTMDDKQLALARFADQQGRQGTRWSVLRDRWNESHPDPEWRYETEDLSARRFGLDCRTAWSRLTGAKWPDATRENEEQGGAT